ncbi:DUF6099 family protein [Streptomyces albus]|uniref:Uncharacterized protein n=1 Tax=Streptomyces albus TaxID=1888 RepID=A0A6C1C8N8_9ACTN|nr:MULTISPECIES: DUF6099 family protein [Streptomyces]KPC90956.1 hypothetical protein ADL27_33450 [Streptomyces sp. NRRL F-6602]EPD93716.1 hypothetical protein HMPREF1486_03572 [Streptomyces sp. HPH0547]QID38689.1 hypothetical protein G3260_005385 [Streptomyces albus]TGG80458.1 hypothetical protein D8771_21940 [Streptomyces albus]UVN54305.1 DUF6099 family protein [Streptomyces albus]
MDAVRLIAATRQALALSADVADVVTEAWQAQALAVAVGSHLAVSGPPAVRSEALGLSEVGTRAGGSRHHTAPRAGGLRAAQLSAIDDPRRTLDDLGALLGEAGVALVGVAVTAEDETLYWQCMEAIDAADESGDRVTAILRTLSMRERGSLA